MVMWRISTGVSAIAVSPLVVEPVENRDEDNPDHHEEEHSDDRREVDRPERGQQPAEEPQVRLADVVEKALDPVQPGRVRQPPPPPQDVTEDQGRVEPNEAP